jgi:hypothetical protein
MNPPYTSSHVGQQRRQEKKSMKDYVDVLIWFYIDIFFARCQYSFPASLKLTRSFSVSGNIFSPSYCKILHLFEPRPPHITSFFLCLAPCSRIWLFLNTICLRSHLSSCTAYTGLMVSENQHRINYSPFITFLLFSNELGFTCFILNNV